MSFFKKNKKEEFVSKISEAQEAQKQRDWIRGELEFDTQPKNHQMRANPDKNVTLGMLLSALDISKDEIGDMYVVSNYLEMQGQLIQDIEQVWNYDLCSVVLNKPDEHDGEISEKFAEHVILNIWYKRKKNELETDKMYTNDKFKGTNDLIIVHLRVSGAYDGYTYGFMGKETSYVCATVCIPPFAYDKHKIPATDYRRLQGDIVSLTIAYDMRSPKLKLEEFHYIKEDVADKIKNNKIDELSDIQRFFLDNVRENIGKDFYFGKKLMEKRSYGNAIEYFTNVFEYLNFGWTSDDERYIFFESCYNLGFCYCEIQRYEKAMYYLDIIYPINNVRYKMEYINCLVNKKDFRAFNVVTNELDRILKIRQSEWTEEYRLYYQFLARRKAYLYIDMGRLDEAENLLKDMLKIKESEDFALNELAHIQTIKNQQK